MGSCESNSCFEFLPIQTSVIPGNSYKNCTLTPALMTLVFTPQLIGVNGSFTVAANGVLINTMYFQNGNVSSFVEVPGVKPTFDAFGNINLTFTNNVAGLRRGIDYLVGDNYEIRIPQNAGCDGLNGNGAFIVFSRPDRSDVGAITPLPTPLPTIVPPPLPPASNTGAIIGIVLGVILLFLFLMFIIYLIYNYNNKPIMDNVYQPTMNNVYQPTMDNTYQ